MLLVHMRRFTFLSLLLCFTLVSSYAQPGPPDDCIDFDNLAPDSYSIIEDAGIKLTTNPNSTFFVQDYHPILGGGFDYFEEHYLSTGSNPINVDLSQLPAHTSYVSFEFLQYDDSIFITLDSFEVAFTISPNYYDFTVGPYQILIEEEDDVPAPWHAGKMTILGDIQSLVINMGGESMIDNLCYQLQQTCAIHEVIAEWECDTNANNIFYVELDLDYQNTSDSFSVAGNGNNYGTFSYTSLPIRLGPFIGVGQLDYEFVAIDQQNPNCQNFIELGNIDCSQGGPCSIRDVVATASPCTPNEQFNVTIDFNYSNVGTDFMVIGNGAFYGAYNYSQLPITLPVLFDADGSIYQFNIFDLGNPNCISFAEVGPVDCNADCEIEGFVFERGDCNPDGSYVVEIDFDVNNPGNDFFDVFNARGDIIGTYRIADLPIRIPDYPHNGFVIDTVEVCINDTPDCCTGIVFDSPPCVDLCQIKAPLDIDIVDCRNNEFFLKINFDYSNVSDSFFLGVASNQLGFFSYDDLPVVVGPFPSGPNNLYNAFVYDQIDVSCTQSSYIGAVDCDNICRLWDLEREIVECEQGEYYMQLTYNYTDSDSARIFIDGNFYGVYSNSQQPILVGPLVGDGQTPVTVQLKDENNPSCATDEITFQPVFCDSLPCLPNLVARAINDCDANGTFPLVINFNNPPIQTDSFEVRNSINGYIGWFAIADLPVTIPNYSSTAPLGSTTDFVSITLENNQSSLNCHVEFDIPDCAITSCEIGEIEIDLIDCNGDDAYIKLNFDFNQWVSDSFYLRGNGISYGVFSYEDLPISLGPLDGSNTTFYEFVVIDLDNPDCKSSIDFGRINCGNTPCQIRDFVAEFAGCNPNGTYDLDINFFVSNNTVDSFGVSTEGGVFLGYYALSNLPLTIQNYPGNGGPTDIVNVCLPDSPNCCARTQFDVENCGNGNCEMGEIELEVVECIDSFFYVRIDFEYANNASDSFNLRGNGVDYGYFLYRNLPLVFGPLEADNQTSYEFVAIDAIDPNCASDAFLGTVNCFSSCEVEIATESIACNPDGSFSVLVNVVYQDPNIDSVTLAYPNANFPRATYALTDMPIIITDFPSVPQNQSFLIAETIGCIAETLVEQLDCDNCELFDLTTRISPCDNDDRFDVTIDFDFNNIGNIGFQVIDQQGVSYGPFNYNELPITLEDLTAQPGGISTFTIFDILNFNCSLTADVDHPDCANFCDGFSNIDLGEYPAADYEEDDVVFTVNNVPVYMLPFQYTNTTSDRIKFVMEEVFSPAALPIRGHALFTGNSTALFDFTELTEKVSTGNHRHHTRHILSITLAVNGEPVQVISNLYSSYRKILLRELNLQCCLCQQSKFDVAQLDFYRR